MPQLQRAFLVDQVDAALRKGIAEGEWVKWLPAERRLAEELQVGRNSLRLALQRLAADGVIEVIPGRGHRLVAPRARATRAMRPVIGILAPFSLEELRPRQALWVDEFRGMLGEHGMRMRFLAAPQCFGPKPGPSLRRLVAEERCAVWILLRSTNEAQTWFAREGVPCVIAGTCHQGVALPSVDLDYRAMCRHAATLLLRHGHRRLAFITTSASAAGDMQSEAGFAEGLAAFPAPGRAVTVRVRADRDGVARAVRRLMMVKEPPTAILVNQSYHYLTVFSVLSSLGFRIPRDVSLLCRDEDHFLSYLEPEPTRYVENPRLFARKLVRQTQAVLRHPSGRPAQVRLIPRLGRGASVAAPKSP